MASPREEREPLLAGASNASSTAELYESLPLEPGTRSIRVLDLFPLSSQSGFRNSTRATGDGENLQGQLRKVCLSDSPQFSALSYMWGLETPNNDPLNTIHCGTCVIPLTSNCAKALRVLRRRVGRQPCLSLWVDAICINQKDVDEKSDQIPLMEEIYQWANPVFIWLGDATEASDRVFEHLRYLAVEGGQSRSIQSLPWILDSEKKDRARKRRQYIWRHKFGPSSLLHLCFRVAGFYPALPLLGPSWLNHRNEFKSDWHDILSRDWFGRAWTFQELVLAVNPTMLCGHMEVSWVDFVSGFEIELGRSFMNTSLHAVGSVWMNIPRHMQWNGRAMRQTPFGLNSGPLSLRTYLSTVSRRQVCSNSVLNTKRAEWCHVSRPILLIRWLTTAVDVLLALLPYYSFNHGLDKLLPQRPTVVTLGFIALCIAGSGYALIRGIIGFAHAVKEDTCVTPIIAGEQVAFPVHHASVIRDLGRQQRRNPRSTPGSQSLPSTTVIMRGLMHNIRDRVASNPRDKFYSLYGVMKALQIDLPPVDYSMSIGSLFQQLFSTLLGWEPAVISLMVEAGIGTGLDAGTPSWVPNWHSHESRSWIDYTYAYNICNYSATPLSTPCASVHGSRLTVAGYFCDAATLCSPPLRRTTEAGNALQALDCEREALVFFSKWIALARRDIAYNQAYEPLPQAVLRAINGRSTLTPNSQGEREAHDFNSWYRIVADAGHRQLTESCDDDTLFDGISRDLATDLGAWNFFVRSYKRLAGARCLFFTQNGHLGTGPEKAVAGDRIALIAGVPMPLVLRQSTYGSYRLVGASLILGLENGEEWKRLHAATEPENITLV